MEGGNATAYPRGRRPGPPSTGPSLPRRSLVQASLEVGRVLADRDGVTFRAQGTCMYPAVRPGDLLRIRSCAVRDLETGQIAVCRAAGFLLAHRVIERGERDGRAFVRTRADRAQRGGDAPVFDEDLLGCVVAITRRGRAVSPAGRAEALRFHHRLAVAFVETSARAGAWLRSALDRSGAWRPGRWAARARMRLLRPRASWTVAVPLNATLGESVCRHVDPERFDPEGAWNGRTLGRWTLELRLNGSKRPAATATFARDSVGTWRLDACRVRARFRGTGLDDLVLERAGGILARPASQTTDDPQRRPRRRPRR